MTHTDPIVVIHLPISKVNVVLQSLAELPIKVAGPTYETVRKQAEDEVRRQNDFLTAAQADPAPQENVKQPPEPGEADSAAS